MLEEGGVCKGREVEVSVGIGWDESKKGRRYARMICARNRESVR